MMLVIAHDQNWSMDDWITIAIAIPFVLAVLWIFRWW